jgi:ribosome-associated translation inhibitor RaiA
MDHPVEIALRGISPSAALERYVGEEARKLERICDRIRGCRVLAERLQGESGDGRRCAVRLMVRLPDLEIVVNRENGGDVYIAVRDAFAAAGLQLAEYMRRARDRGRDVPGPPGAGGRNSRRDAESS